MAAKYLETIPISIFMTKSLCWLSLDISQFIYRELIHRMKLLCMMSDADAVVPRLVVTRAARIFEKVEFKFEFVNI
jgi:hypothetical protein